MRLIAYRDQTTTFMAELKADRVRTIDTIEDFYAHGCDVSRGLDEPERPIGSVRQVPPVPPTAKIFCAGVNYAAHAEESERATGLPSPSAPMIFGRWFSTLVANGDPVPTPVHEGLDWECELAVIVGRDAWATTENDAESLIFGYTVFNDLSARSKQLETSQFTLGKNSDRSGPIGPVVVTRSEIGDPYSLRLRTWVNGNLKQDGSTSAMIHPITKLLAYINDTVSLTAGDVITTGTPGGVALGDPQAKVLAPGDVVEVEIERIGLLRNPIVDRRRLAPAS